ncbi:MAG: D-glycero-beta-D-manno-heptose 1-phosphate adenylyltransferase [Armatimonadetes bacterium]|nr:D-glycero-beta-D-manno-heptose 1-phosphate adenylyltransferase [Armatimonadota bacterium]
MNPKIKSFLELKSIVQNLKTQNKKIIFTNGCFDILHLGHITYLREAKNLGDILIIGLNSDESIKKIKGNSRPILPQNERAEILAALEMVDFIIIFNEETPENLILEFKPDIQVKGGDYKKEDLKEAEIVKNYGGKVIIVSFLDGYSTSNLINKMKNASFNNC